jgi:hypothetical protein
MQAHTHGIGRRWWVTAALSGTSFILLVAGAMLGASSIAAGEGHGARRSLIGTRCQEEISKMCDDVKPGGGRLARCLREHEAELSNDCKAALAASWTGRARATKKPQQKP